MPHFSDTFHVKPDLTRGELRVSVRVSEMRIDEWWIPAVDARDVLALEGVEGWRGHGALKIRFSSGSADVALYDKGGNRTVIRAFSSAVKLFLAQIRAALIDVPVAALEERLVIQSRGADEDIIKEAVKLVVQEEMAATRAAMLQSIRVEMQNLKAVLEGGFAALPASRPAAPAVADVSSAVPTFIPSTVGKAQLKGSVTAKTTSSSSLDDAIEALKATQGKKK
jgi:hypothetical protein